MGAVIGIPVYFHFTFLIIIPVFSAFFALTNANILGITLGFGDLRVSILAKAILGIICALLFFLTILLHELGHSYVAVRHGYGIKSITLLLFGGVAQMEDTPREPGVEGWMAFVGPATSFLVGLILIPSYFLLDGVRNPGVAVQALQITCGIIGFYNLLLGGFNLIPAFPMDGGRILRSFLAKRVGFLEATDTAVKVGKVIAIAMVVVGFVFLDVFVILVALFIYAGASEEGQMAKLTVALDGVKVREIMNPTVFWVEPAMSLDKVLERMLKEQRTAYPVVENGVLIGVVSVGSIGRVRASDRQAVTAGAVANRSPAYAKIYMDAVEVLKLMGEQNDFIVVLDEHDDLVGSVSKDDLRRIVSVLSVQKGI